MDELAKYDYQLPRHLIAQSPTACRSDARLLVADRARNSLEHKHIRDLPELLGPGDCLVINDTRVIPARLVGYRNRTGGRWQGLFLEAEAAQPPWDRRRQRLRSPGQGLLGSGTRALPGQSTLIMPFCPSADTVQVPDGTPSIV